MKWAAEQMNITKMSDWYDVSKGRFQQLGGMQLVQKRGGLGLMLSRLFTECQWDFGVHRTLSSKGQMQLFRVVQQVFSTSEVVLNYRHPGLMGYELDVYVVNEEIAFEYQGQQHYHWNMIFGSAEKIKRRDIQKQSV